MDGRFFCRECLNSNPKSPNVTLNEVKGSSDPEPFGSRSLGFFAPDGRSHRPEAVSLRENDMIFLMLGTPGIRLLKTSALAKI